MEEKQLVLSEDLAHRLAALDIGSNSIRLIVAEALRGGNYRVLDEEKEAARLGARLSSTGRLDPDAIERALLAIRRMRQIADGFQVKQMRVIATCAVREAADGPDFVRRVHEEVGLDVEVVSSKVEAQLAFFSVARAFDLTGKNVAVADIGGGSTEIVLASGNLIEQMCPTQLGAVRLGEMFGGAQPMLGEQFGRLVDHIDRELRRQTRKVDFQPHILIGSGGTFTTLADIIMAQKGVTGLPLRGYEVTRAEVSHLLDRLRKLSPKARRNVPGLSADRADIIVPGVAIIDRLMHRFHLNRVQIHDRGVRDGLLLTMIDSSLGEPSENPHDQEAAINRLASHCGVDLQHSIRVARLATMIFDCLAERNNLPPDDRRLLDAAARLQDVGYLINYEDHHKHSYHLILNSRLAGFKPHDLELVANVARYHRGSAPKKKHVNFRQLSPRDQDRVRKLAAILRVAGGLDRSNQGLVDGVTITQMGRTMVMHVQAREIPELEIWTAQRRAELFEDAFKVTLTVQWDDPNATNGAVAESAEHTTT